MGFMFEIFPILFFMMFILVFGVIVSTMVREAKRERKNDISPRLTVEAKVVAKRTNYHRHSGANHSAGHTHTSYFSTFEVESGDRMELALSGNEYGLLVEGDFGDLTFQGTRFLGFRRKAKTYDLS